MKKKNRGKFVLRFLFAAVCVQMLMLLVCTCGALEKILPVYVRAVSEKVSLGDDSYTEFFPIRQYMAETSVDLIVIGVDFSYEETYALLTDLIVSMKNDVNIGTICIDSYPNTMGYISTLISAKDEENRQNILSHLKSISPCSDAFCEFVLELSRMKDSYPPQRQYTGGTAIGGSVEDSFMQQIIASAQVYKKRTNRPVLLITETQNLRVNAELRSLLRNTGDITSLCIQCHYSNSEKTPAERQPEVKLLQQQKLHLFDELYSDAAKRADGQYPDFRFSDIYTTEISFLMYECTPAEQNSTEEP